MFDAPPNRKTLGEVTVTVTAEDEDGHSLDLAVLKGKITKVTPDHSATCSVGSSQAYRRGYNHVNWN